MPTPPTRKLPDELSIKEIISEIVKLNTGLRDFWRNSHGWAPIGAAQLLSKSRLDWQVSMSESLHRWVDIPAGKDAASTQLLGYANLGALVEGTLKLFLSVFYNDYKGDTDAIKKKDAIVDPDGVTLEPMRQFFKKRIWADTPRDNWDAWILRIQNRRNAIHAFKDREIGTHSELVDDIRIYFKLVRRINGQLPYPDGHHGPDDHFLARDTDAPAVTA
jgi:hypothetical protein